MRGAHSLTCGVVRFVGDGGLKDGGLNGALAGEAGDKTAGDLRKLFFRQLRELLAHGFHFLFQGVQFFFGFHGV